MSNAILKANLFDELCKAKSEEEVFDYASRELERLGCASLYLALSEDGARLRPKYRSRIIRENTETVMVIDWLFSDPCASLSLRESAVMRQVIDSGEMFSASRDILHAEMGKSASALFYAFRNADNVAIAPLKQGGIIVGAIFLFFNAPCTNAFSIATCIVHHLSFALVLNHERNKSEQMKAILYGREREYRELVENISDIIFSIDLNGRITHINKAVEKYGLDRKRLLYERFYHFLLADDRKRLFEVFHKALNGQEPDIEEIKFVSRNKKELWFECKARIKRDKNSMVIGLFGVLREITERKKHEAELLDGRARLEEKNAALREVLQFIEEQRLETVRMIKHNIERTVLPALASAVTGGHPDSKSRKSIALAIENLKEIESTFLFDIEKSSSRLSPREIEICSMIKKNLTSKEIASVLSLSIATVETHRQHIRRKLKLGKKNLRSHLNSIKKYKN